MLGVTPQGRSRAAPTLMQDDAGLELSPRRLSNVAGYSSKSALQLRVVPGFGELAGGGATALEDALVLQPRPAQGVAQAAAGDRQVVHLHSGFALQLLEEVASLLGVRLR